MDITLTQAIDKLVSELKNDNVYYYGWQSNIAMSFHDTLSKHIESREIEVKSNDFSILHNIVNEAAKNFLTILIYQPNNEQQTSQTTA